MGDKVLILGATGMLGHTLFRNMHFRGTDIYGTVRNKSSFDGFLTRELVDKTIDNVEANCFDSIRRIINELKPGIVINCIGIIKQLPSANDPITAININSLLPHRLARLCAASGARFIHISTDCVFDGVKGGYTEKDPSNATDLYGRSKFLGEVDYPNSLTLRTSIIGHELKGNYGLVEWFLSQNDKVRGFTKAIYTGFPTIELARIIAEYVIPNPNLTGLYQVSSDPISKFELLKLVAQRYGKEIEIEPYDDFQLDRSLNSSLFRSVTGYIPPSWPELIDEMYQDFQSSRHYELRHRR